MEDSRLLRDARLLVIAGPTASGKTGLSVELAKRLNGEIISADSMQVYRRMDIGTAKVTKEEMQGIPHHLIDCIEPTEPWNVMLFKERAEEAIRTIHERGRLPIVCGGTGFYLRALLYDAQFYDEPGGDETRAELEMQMKELGPIAMHERLRAVDPESAEKIHPHNEKRVIRALEYYRLHGEPISLHNARQQEKVSPYTLCFLGLEWERSHLYERIDARVDRMIEDGLIDEVKTLLAAGIRPEMTSMQGLGYKEIVPYLLGEESLEEAIRVLKRDTRHFAKRQLTWFRSEKEIHWIDMEASRDAGVSDALAEIKRLFP